MASPQTADTVPFGRSGTQQTGAGAGKQEAGKQEALTLAFGNRHGLVAGATGTGKTVSLQVLAEGFSNAGVPVFAADVKGDLAGLSQPGAASDAVTKRAGQTGLDWQPDRFPVAFWDAFGEQGTPIRTTVSEMGPLLLSRLLGLNDVQSGALTIAFTLADKAGLLLLDLKDLRALLDAMLADPDAVAQAGGVTKTTIQAIQRRLMVLETAGGTGFFGEPGFEIADLLRTDRDGRGVVNVLAADKLMSNPQLYAALLLWLLSELFEELPEVGDPAKPKLVFFFDEAHLLFTDVPEALLQTIEKVVRLIRSKGVGVYFVTQNPLDVPDRVLGQLGNRVQHALRAFTPRDQKAVRAAAETFRANPGLDTASVIGELGKGEALVSFLEGEGVPEPVERTLVQPPASRIGPVSAQERAATVRENPLGSKYAQAVDRESAFEVLQARAAQRQGQGPGTPPTGAQTGGAAPQGGGALGTAMGWLGSVLGDAPAGGRGSSRMSTGEAMVRSAARSMASTAGRQLANALIRGVLGGLTRP